jgi:hypothetical protein
VPYRVIVEPQEHYQYAAVIDPARLLVLDPAYKRRYETCDDLGTTKSTGSGPARNFAWDHAEASGAERHWVLDDNILDFHRFHRNMKMPARTGAFFTAMEDFVDRYENIAMAGPQYFKFVKRKDSTVPPFITNTRIYSCNLIRTDLPFRWRGRYNEDTILSLDLLKAGWCTVQFHAFLQDKTTSQRMKGGNTTELYADGTLEKSQMLARVHPDVARVVWRFNRWHHHVDYRPFKRNRLKLKPGIDLESMEPNEYGMVLARIGDAA